MKLYLSVIGIAMAVVAALNLIFEVAPWYYVIAAVIWCTALQFALDGLLAIIIRITPDRYFGADDPHFAVSESAQALYKRLRVSRWKDSVLELGGLGGFSKKSLKEPTNPKYIEKFIIECNKGVVTHRLSYPIGFLAMLTVDGICAFTVALPIAVVNVFLNVLPTLVLRYNTPPLQKLLSRMNKKLSAAADASARN